MVLRLACAGLTIGALLPFGQGSASSFMRFGNAALMRQDGPAGKHASHLFETVMNH